LEGDVTIAKFNIQNDNSTITLKNLTGMVKIDWGDGNTDTLLSHTYVNAGEYECKIYGVTEIGVRAFEYAPVTELNISNNITTIREFAFYECTKLTTITMGENIEYLYSDAFSKRSMVDVDDGGDDTEHYTHLNIHDVVIKNIKKWCDITFDNATANPIAPMNNRENLKGSTLYLGSKEESNILTTLEIPYNVDFINEYAFSNCSTIQKLIFSKNASIEIGNNAFDHCVNLTSVEFSNGLEIIGAEAFRDCDIVELIIPDTVTLIGEKAFYGCSNLATVNIGSNVSEIRGEAFSGCTNLINISINSQSVMDNFKNIFPNF
jgi:hypothetical protein